MVSAAASAFKGVIETFATFTYPAKLTGRNTYHEGIVLNILGDDGTGTDEGGTAYGVTTDDCAVGTEGSPFLDERLGIDAVNREVGTGCCDIGKDAGGTAEHVVLNLYTFIDRHIVLNTDTIADAGIVADVNILSQGAVSAEAGTLLDMAEVPNLCAFAYLYIVIDVTAFVNVVFLHHSLPSTNSRGMMALTS